jgi:hypothetical protein
MSHHPKLVRARHTQGLAAYRAGHGIDHVMDIAHEIDEMHKQPDLTNEEHEEIENSTPSFIAGYVSGVIDDIRMLARQRGQRA